MSKPDVAVTAVVGGRQYTIMRAEMVCPHCGVFSTAEGPSVNNKYCLVTCLRCQCGVMIEAQHIQPGVPITDYFPKKVPTVDPYVPKDIGEDFLEAQRCFMAGAWHGCAVMARRCMHSVAEHFNATGKDLYEQIENLKTTQVITPVLAEQAQHVRVLGKHGAHPYDMRGNPLKDLGLEDAQAALDFCEFIFDQVFIQPEKIKASKTRVP
jgi:hypothetical protein